MRLLKQALVVLGTVVVIAIFAALVTPKTAHAIVATFVQVVNTPARTAVGLTANTTIFPVGLGNTDSFQDFSGNTYTVPAGQRLVVESASVQFFLPTGQIPLNVFVGLGAGQDRFLVVPVFVGAVPGAVPGQDLYEASLNIKAYADPGVTPSLSCERGPTAGGFAECFATLYGHTESIQ
jgi:hypothetical protein